MLAANRAASRSSSRARRLGLPVELVLFNSTGSVVEAVNARQVDVAFVATALQRHGIERAAVAPARSKTSR